MNSFSGEPLSATIGFFDGVHKGHRHILSSLTADALSHGTLSCVVTFRQHPRQVLRQDYVPKLLTLWQTRKRLLEESGVDRVVMLDFTPAFSRQTAEEFMTFLRDEYNVRRLLVGYDHRFGRDRAGGLEDYRLIGKRIGVEIVADGVFSENGTNVSSSAIRRLLAAGDILLANEYLGRRYGFCGTVVRGRGEGRKIGFPTANMALDAEQLVPARGVYGAEVEIEGYAEKFTGMMNIGCRPTYGGGGETVEVNIFGFDDDIYGRRLAARLFTRLREERKFASAEELRSQLFRDKTAILASL